MAFKKWGDKLMAKPIQDFEGNKFESIKAMCRFWGIDTGTYARRIKKMSMREALTKPILNTKKGL